MGNYGVREAEFIWDMNVGYGKGVVFMAFYV